MNFLSVCSGIEAASCAWNPLGWEASAFSEIEPFPCSVLAHRFPTVPNLGDMTKFKDWPDDLSVDLLCGGTPCQSFSVAGLRKGLADPRGNLMLTYGAIAAKYRPRWLVWENVPGVLSSNGGRDFGSFLGLLGELGYGFAYRVLDAQYFGVAQRRRRVFVVGCFGDWRSAAAVLFERHGLQGHPAPSRQAREGAAGCLMARAGRGFNGQDAYSDQLVTHALTGEGFDASEDGTGRGTPLVTVLPFDTTQVTSVANRSNPRAGDPCHPLAAGAHAPAIVGTLTSNGDAHSGFKDENGLVPNGAQVRRLTPTECERLQGFPDGWTNVPHRGKPAADGPRYKALGNSWAVPCAAWIGRRIDAVEAVTQELEDA